MPLHLGPDALCVQPPTSAGKLSACKHIDVIANDKTGTSKGSWHRLPAFTSVFTIACTKLLSADTGNSTSGHASSDCMLYNVSACSLHKIADVRKLAGTEG